MTEIQDIPAHEKKLESFIDNWKQFHGVFGGRSFLTKDKGNPGGDETFCMHVLRFCVPKIARTTLDEDGCGVEIFTMQ